MRVQDWANCALWAERKMPCPWLKLMKKDDPKKEFGGGPERRRRAAPGRKQTRFSDAVKAALLLGFTLAEAEALAKVADRLKKEVGKPGRVPSPVPVGGLIALMVLTFLSLLARGSPPGLATAMKAERTVIRSTRFRAPAMTGGRGGWHVNMSQLGLAGNQLRSVSPADQVRRRGYFAPEVGHPGN